MDEWKTRTDRYERRFSRLVQHGFPGLEFGPGWDDLIMDLMEGIDQALTDEEAAGFSIFQIKEKFGTLPFYWGTRGATSYESLNERIEPLVELAEKLSAITCMRCGAAGTLRPRGWAHVSCDRCEIERLRKLDER